MKRIFRAQHLVTCNSKHEVIKDAFLAIDGKHIVDVGAWKKRPKARAWKVIDASYGMITPTLFNLHTHLPMSLLRGIAEDQKLEDWLFQTILPLEKKHVSPSFVKKGTELALRESIRNGVTFFCDMYFYETDIAKTAEKMGVRGVFCQNVWDIDSPDSKSLDECLSRAEKHLQTFPRSDRIIPGIAPHAIYTTSLKTIQQCADLAKAHNGYGMVHLAETKTEFNDSIKNFGRSPTAQVAASGFLDLKHVILAHSVWMDDEDYKLLKRPNVSVALNPQCNAKLASGIPPVDRYRKEGIRFVLGTDGACSNNNLDIFEEMNFLSKIHHVSTGDLTGLPGPELFDAATIRAAEAVGVSDRLGSLEPGKEADFLIIDLRSAHLQPMHNPYAYLIYSVRGSDVSSVYVQGNRIWGHVS